MNDITQIIRVHATNGVRSRFTLAEKERPLLVPQDRQVQDSTGIFETPKVTRDWPQEEKKEKALIGGEQQQF